jgi:predicted DNA-binding transcriptional regulator AlpA
MSSELDVLLRQLAADPEKLVGISSEQEQALVASLCAVVAGEERPSSPALHSMPPDGRTASSWIEGDLLTIDEAAAMIKLSKRWLYRHAKNLPFARKLSRKVLRFSRSGITRWLATKRHD